jgi:hypothetical protein
MTKSSDDFFLNKQSIPDRGIRAPSPASKMMNEDEDSGPEVNLNQKIRPSDKIELKSDKAEV